jgi:hypothetical protein
MPHVKRRDLALGAAGLLLLAFAGWFMLNAGELRRAWFLRHDMREAAPGVLVAEGLSDERASEFAALAAAARARAEDWFGPLRNTAVVVFVHDARLKGELGMEQPFAWNPIEEGNARVYIGPKGLSVDLVAHGIAHAEIKERAGLDLWPRLPAWFDEGLATQLDLRPFLQPEALGRAEEQGAAALQPLASHDAFRGGEGEAALVRSKREVTRWLAAVGGRPAMDELFAALRAGEDFSAAYPRLEAARTARPR